jgi:hypothetical protein
LKVRLRPYGGKKGTAASEYLKRNPLTISVANANSLDKAVKQSMVEILVSRYNAAVDAANTRDCSVRIRFERLPRSVQTAIASISFQYGSLESKTPRFWLQITEQRWQDAVENLKNFGDTYPSRRKLEAGLMESAIDSASRQQLLP